MNKSKQTTKKTSQHRKKIDFNQLIETQIQKILTNHLRNLSERIDFLTFNQKAQNPLSQSSFLDGFNYTANQFTSNLIKTVFKKF